LGEGLGGEADAISMLEGCFFDGEIVEEDLSFERDEAHAIG
jgi:hypothetical protein